MKTHQPKDYDTHANCSSTTELAAWAIIVVIVFILVVGIYA